MKLRTVTDPDGTAEYVLLPTDAFRKVRREIESVLGVVEVAGEDDFIDFDPARYVSNPVSLARIEKGLTQAELAGRMGVSQSYISKLENSDEVSPAAIAKVLSALDAKGQDGSP